MVFTYQALSGLHAFFERVWSFIGFGSLLGSYGRQGVVLLM